MLGDPAGEAFAELAGEERQVDELVGADPPLEGDRDDVRAFHEVDPGVVVVDEPAGLLDDRAPDLIGRRRTAESRRRRLQHLELGGPGDRLLEQLGVGQRDRGVGREGRDERDVAARP